MKNSYHSYRITIAAGIFPPDIGGPATYVVKLGDVLVQQGWRVNVVCYSSQSENGKWKIEDRNYNFKVYRVLRKGNIFLRYWRYFWKLVEVAKGSDIIYAQGPVSAGLPAMLAAKMLRKKFIIKVVGDPAWEQAIGRGYTSDMIGGFQRKKYGGKIRYLKGIRSFVCQRADRIITPSEYLAGIAEGWSVESNKIKIVYNAIEDAKMEDRRLKIETDRDVILSVGRLVKWKGFGTLIEIMPELLRENPRFKLLIVGDGPERENYQLSIINYQLQDKVELIGKVSHETVLEYFKKAKMFVLNTGYEGLPHVVLEAMQAGCPVITTNVGGNPEVVRNGETGLLVEYDNKEQLKAAILKMWRDKDLRQRLAEQAKKDLEKFSFSGMISETENILFEVIN